MSQQTWSDPEVMGVLQSGVPPLAYKSEVSEMHLPAVQDMLFFSLLKLIETLSNRFTFIDCGLL